MFHYTIVLYSNVICFVEQRNMIKINDVPARARCVLYVLMLKLSN